MAFIWHRYFPAVHSHTIIWNGDIIWFNLSAKLFSFWNNSFICSKRFSNIYCAGIFGKYSTSTRFVWFSRIFSALALVLIINYFSLSFQLVYFNNMYSDFICLLLSSIFLLLSITFCRSYHFPSLHRWTNI